MIGPYRGNVVGFEKGNRSSVYQESVTSVRTSGGITSGFPITIGLHQGSTQSPYLSLY